MNRKIEKMICFRADANEKIASGHIMRCLSIAQKLRSLGAEIMFLFADEKGKYLVEKTGFRYMVFNTDFERLEEETEFFIRLIQKENISAVILDSYFVTEEYMRKLCSYTKLIYLDDMNSFAYPCDMLINYSPSAKSYNYSKLKPETQILLGLDYAPMREEFEKISKKNIRDGIREILILSGGTDPFNFASFISEQLMGKREIHITIITGAMNSNKDELLNIEKESRNVEVHINTDNISYYMKKADLAITAGGSTIFELCACGTPMICYTFADNQIPAAEELNNIGAMRYAGDLRNGVEECIQRCLENVNQLQDESVRKGMSDLQQKLVDGKGAARLANEIMELIQ